ncbi:MAG: hypothetical protein ACLSCV_09355 [Acutalibacteraceae bacterium]
MSRKIVIDRFEGTYAICEDKTKFCAVKLQNCEGAKKGMLEIKDTVLPLIENRPGAKNKIAEVGK